MLKELHAGHQGIVKMKAPAHKYVWWPKVDADVKQVCRACESCQVELKTPRQVPLHPWEFPGQELEKTAHRLCRSFLRTHIHDSCGCMLQMVGGV